MHTVHKPHAIYPEHVLLASGHLVQEPCMPKKPLSLPQQGPLHLLQLPYMATGGSIMRIFLVKALGGSSADLHIMLEGGLLGTGEEALPCQFICPVIRQACRMQPR